MVQLSRCRRRAARRCPCQSCLAQLAQVMLAGAEGINGKVLGQVDHRQHRPEKIGMATRSAGECPIRLVSALKPINVPRHRIGDRPAESARSGRPRTRRPPLGRRANWPRPGRGGQQGHPAKDNAQPTHEIEPKAALAERTSNCSPAGKAARCRSHWRTSRVSRPFWS